MKIKDPVLKDLADHEAWVDEEAEKDLAVEELIKEDPEMSTKEAREIVEKRADEYAEEVYLIRRYGCLPDI